MPIEYRYLIRPPTILSTPSTLGEALGVRSVRRNARYPSWTRDFFMSYHHHPSEVQNATTEYGYIYSFAQANKRDQRGIIRDAWGIRTPDSYSNSRYVVRPLRHFGGQGFRVTEDPQDYNAQREYISPLFDKRWEYRLVYVRGRHCLTLFKRVDEGTPSDVPWNHSHGSSFMTVNNWDTSCRLRHTSILEDLSNAVPIISHAHIVAVDVMLRKVPHGPWEYAVCEFNFCPSLSIEDNVRKVVEYARHD